MPETVSTAEVAHELGHHRGHDRAVSRRAEIIEILEAVLLAIVAVATAWSGYQTARWDGRQAHEYGLTNKYRALSNQARAGLFSDSLTSGFRLRAQDRGKVGDDRP